MKPINSRDFRKPAIVEVLKEVSGGNKITNVVQVSDIAFAGDAMRYTPKDRSYARLGRFTVQIEPGYFTA